jgi:putative transposase
VTTKRFRYRAYPTPGQEPSFNRAFGCGRVVYNDALHARETAHKAGLPYPKLADLSQRLTEVKKTPERAWLGEVSAVVLQQALADADGAYRNYFTAMVKRKANGGKGRFVGKPRYRSKKDSRQSIRFTRNARFKVRVVNRDRALLTLPGIPGEVMIRLSRPLPSSPSSVTVIREADGRYYVSFVIEAPAKRPRAGTRPSTWGWLTSRRWSPRTGHARRSRTRGSCGPRSGGSLTGSVLSRGRRRGATTGRRLG